MKGLYMSYQAGNTPESTAATTQCKDIGILSARRVGKRHEPDTRDHYFVTALK